MKREKQSVRKQLLATLCGLLGLLLGLSAQMGSAEACSPPDSGVYKREVQPKANATDVPTNARVLVIYNHTTSMGPGLPKAEVVSLEGPGGSAIAAQVTVYRTGAGAAQETKFVLTPTNALAANTTYNVISRLKTLPCGSRGGAPCDTSNELVVSSFTTGANPDIAAPTFTGAKEILCGQYDGCNSGSCCGPYKRTSFSLKWNEATDLGASNATFQVRYNVYSPKDLTKPLLPLVTFRNAIGYIRHEGGHHFPNWSTLEGSPVAGYIVRAVDIAGNEDTNTKVIALASSCQQPPDELPDNPDGGTSPDLAVGVDFGPGTPDTVKNPENHVVDLIKPSPDTTTKPDAGPDAPYTTPEAGQDQAISGKNPTPNPTNPPKQMGCQVSQDTPLGVPGFIMCLLVGLGFALRGKRKQI